MKKNIKFNIKGMHCESCEKIIAMELADLPGVEEVVSISAQDATGSIIVDTEKTSEIDVIKVIEDLGYEATVVGEGGNNE